MRWAFKRSAIRLPDEHDSAIQPPIYLPSFESSRLMGAHEATEKLLVASA